MQYYEILNNVRKMESERVAQQLVRAILMRTLCGSSRYRKMFAKSEVDCRR